MRHPEKADDSSSSDQKSPLFPKMHVNDRDQVDHHEASGGGPKPPPRNKMAIYEHHHHHPAARSTVNTSTTASLLPATMPSPQPLLSYPKYSGISPSGTSPCYVVGQVPPASAAVRLPFYGHSNTSMLPTLPLVPLISQEKKPPTHSSGSKNLDKWQYPELEIFNRSHGSRGCTVAEDSVESYTQREEVGATRVDDIRGVIGVSSRGDTESQNVSNRSKESHLETTLAKSSCGVISPEDVIAIIGKEAFLRLRCEMIKHRKQFADQVFELHRLTAVQRLIARSRRTLFGNKYKRERPSTWNPKEAQKGHSVERQDDNTFRLKSSSGCVTDTFYLPPQRKDPFRVPLITQRPNQETFTGNPKSVNARGIISPWIYPPVGTGNQWLVPIMSPTEGLIYKPYPVPCNPSPAGYMPPPVQVNPPKPTPTTLTLTHQPPGQQSGIRPLQDTPFFFPPYVTPSLPSPSAYEQVGKSESYQHPNAAIPRSRFKSSWKFPTVGSGTVSCQVDATNQARQGGDSTASSSPPDKSHGNILPLFSEEPTALAMLNKPQYRNQQNQSSEQQQKKVIIKVVPHRPTPATEATEATEATARIIRSIWEERKKLD